MVFTKIQRCGSPWNFQGMLNWCDWNTWYEGVQGVRVSGSWESKGHQESDLNETCELTEVMRNGIKLLGGSGQGTEEGTLEKFEREKQH